MKTRQRKLKEIIAITLVVSSNFGIVAPALAQTEAGQEIKNTATATFKDGEGNSYNATSNEVVIKVAEVAGITITAQSPSNPSPNAGDTLFIDFVITNTGNDPTQFFIPGSATLSNPGAFEQNGKIQIVEVNGNSITPRDVPDAGDFTGDLLGTTGANSGSIPPYPGGAVKTGTITVRVPIKVKNSAISGETLTVSLGNTNPVNGQNVDRANNENPNDVYTKDNDNGVGGETNSTPPSNGVREAMATSDEIKVGARLQAFATVLKAVSSYNSGTNPNSFADDVLTYGLALRVENPVPSPTGFIASDLYGTAINVNSDTSKSYVLVSDAIPDQMQLGSTTPVAPSGWQVVYTTDPLSTNAHKANWLTARPSGKITRVGFIYDTTIAPLSKGNVGTGTTVAGFSFTVTPEAGFTGGQVANIAQIFGQSQPGAPVPGTATQIVYDESGDQDFNNGLGGNNPDSTTGGVVPANGGISNGKADPAGDGTDPNSFGSPTGDTNKGNDTGTGAGTKPVGGETTVYIIAATPLNGPENKPAAVGPTDNNDDFTNKSIVVPAGKSPTDKLINVELAFTNTVQNTSASPQEISLLPQHININDLPDGTKVIISNPNVTGATATYNFNKGAGGFVLESGTPIKITVSPGSNANYNVTVQLAGEVEQLKEFPVVINAFIDVNNDGKPDGEPGNKTINRLYTNYLSLVKEARVLEANGTTVVEDYTTDQAKLSAAATPGRIIEYRITYQNISSSGGTDNVILPANSLEITEDGTAGNNTWFNLTLDPKYPTSVNGSATGTGTIQTTTAANGSIIDIKVYINKPGDIAPGANGTFIFQRKIK
ncbi:MAG: hypothetical protein IGS39_04530 [Calothrix sp. C42_A2020_038]|nr:hypothetical protein [Calothrix sp. C42_A2020_038]